MTSFKFMLAPLEDYSDNALRTLCFRHGAELTFTEMARVEGLVRNNKPTLAKIKISDETPVQIQLLASREEQLEKFLQNFKTFSGFEGFNLNLCCPSESVLKAGRGCAMVKRVSKTSRLVSIIRKQGYPVSLKLRLGTNDYEKKHKVYLNLIKGIEADFFVVHAKTGEQRSAEPADFSVFPECVEAANGKEIIANGGIDSAEKVRELQKTGVSGVMIGRAAMRNPAIFDVLKNGCGYNTPNKKIPPIHELKNEYLELAERFNAPKKYRENLLKEFSKKN
ncbi:MAG: tRNA-dihydrouridine synthase family protein [archaeon]|jgi:tRNA-dihydrouridine synthase